MKKQQLFQKGHNKLLKNYALPLIANPENYENIYEIVIEELRQKNPFYN